MALLDFVKILVAVSVAGWCTAATLAADASPDERYQEIAAHGLSFRYPRELTVSVEADDGQPTIIIDSSDSPFAMIQLQPSTGSLSEYHDRFVTVYRASLEEQGAIISRAPNAATRHVLFGTERSATVLQYKLLGTEIHVSLLFLQRNGRTISILLQHEPADAGLAARYFTTITDSLADSK